MAETIERFPVSEKGFSLPVRNVLTGRGFVTGKSGSGKSNTASVVAEELLERGLGLLIVDTDGEYGALKDRYELLHVGGDEFCDREITVEDASLVADLALDENVPIVLDVSGYVDGEVADDVVYAVVRELFVAEKRRRKPFLLFVEEAHEFIPQRGGGDDLHKMLVRVAKRGRKRGLGICAMSQRPAAVSKDYITQCDWLVWHRLTWENDTDVAGRILGGDAADSVQSLDDGEALVMTDWDETISRVQFRRKKTVDEGSAPDVRDAYGPPSAREDHVTQTGRPNAHDGTGFGGASAVDDAATQRDDYAGARDGYTGSERDDYAGTHRNDATTQGGDYTGIRGDDHTAGPDDDGIRTGHAREPRHDAFGETGIRFPDETTVPREPDSVGGLDEVGPIDWEPGNADGDSRRPPPESDPPVRADSSDVTRESNRPRRTDGATNVPVAPRRRSSRPHPSHARPDEYDPLWELGQLIVYCYGVVVGVHGRLLRRIDAFFLARFDGLRRRTVGRGQRQGRRRLERRLARAISVTLVLGFYALVFAAVSVVAV